MRGTLGLLLFSACSYTSPGPGTGDDGDPTPDASVTPPAVSRSCGATGTALCIDFEQDTADATAMDRALDGSGNLHDGIATHVIATRRVLTPPVPDDQAAMFNTTSQLEIADDLGVDQSFTVEMWMELGSTTTRSWLLDSNRRFFLSVGADKKVRCGINFSGTDDANQRLDTARTITDSNWHHVACTFDHTQAMLKVYIDGASNDCMQLDTLIIPIPGGTTIGAPHVNATTADHLVGTLDSVRVYSRELDGHAICALAGRGDTCTSQCQPGGTIHLGF